MSDLTFVLTFYMGMDLFGNYYNGSIFDEANQKDKDVSKNKMFSVKRAAGIMDERIDDEYDDWVDECTDGQINRWIDGLTNGYIIK